MTLYLSNRDGDGKTDEEGHYKFPVNAFAGNVLNATDLVVTEQAPVALGVTVAPGQYRIPDTTGAFAYTGWNDVATNIGITTADPANPRLSAIVIYIDKAASTSPTPPNNPGVAKFMAVNGTAAAVPVIPNGAAIQAAVGAGNPYIVLATARVNAAGTTVPNAQIVDLRTMVTLASNLANNASIQDLAISTGKMQDSSVTTAKVGNVQITTPKTKPTYRTQAGNNGASRQTFPTGSTTYTVVGSSFSYTSGVTAELLQIKGHAMTSFTAGGHISFLTVNGIMIGRSFYSDYTGWLSKWVEGWYEIPANTTITIDYRCRTSATGGGTVCNSASDQSSATSFGIQMYLTAWGRS